MASHSEVAHRWAQDDANAREISGFNMFFERRETSGYAGTTYGPEHIIFSYGRHFPIAAFQTDANGRRVVLFTSRDYSVSTSKHKSHVSRAIPSHYTVFRVPHVSPMHKPGGGQGFHSENLRAYLDRAAELYGKAKRARVNAPYYTRQAEGLLEEARAYAVAFRARFAIPDTLAEAAKASEAIAAKQAKAEAAARRKAEKARAERERAQREADAPDFAAWQRGEPGSRCPSSYRSDEKGNAYLRRSPDGSELQTSQGASVPWEHAVKAFRFIKLCRENGKGWKTNGRVIRVGHFTVSEITDKGDMRAGCHAFAWREIERLAKAEGVYSVAPSSEAVEPRA